MMPAKSYQIPNGNRVLVFLCETCGEPASFGVGVNILEALRTGRPELAGKWTCGPNGCRNPNSIPKD